MITAVVYLAVNFLVDIVYGIIDPRNPHRVMGPPPPSLPRAEAVTLARAAGMTVRGNQALTIGVVIVGAWLLAAVAGPLIAKSPVDVDVMNRLQPPSLEHLFGTDEAGRDNFSRIVYGARISIPAALGVIVVATVVGSIIGAVAGTRAAVDEILIARLVDVVLAFPSILLAMAIVALGRTQACDARHDPRVVAGVRPADARPGSGDQAERLRDVGERWAARPGESSACMIPSAPDRGQGDPRHWERDGPHRRLSFLGLGAVPPGRVGGDDRGGRTKFEYWWVATFPGLAILSVVFGFNFLGDGLQDWLNPRLRRGGSLPSEAFDGREAGASEPSRPSRGVGWADTSQGLLDPLEGESVHSILDRICEFLRKVST